VIDIGPLILAVGLAAVLCLAAGLALAEWASDARGYTRGRADQYAECARAGHHSPVREGRA
jgi:hypothetical protein